MNDSGVEKVTTAQFTGETKAPKISRNEDAKLAEGPSQVDPGHGWLQYGHKKKYKQCKLH